MTNVSGASPSKQHFQSPARNQTTKNSPGKSPIPKGTPEKKSSPSSKSTPKKTPEKQSKQSSDLEEEEEEEVEQELVVEEEDQNPGEEEAGEEEEEKGEEEEEPEVETENQDQEESGEKNDALEESEEETQVEKPRKRGRPSAKKEKSEEKKAPLSKRPRNSSKISEKAEDDKKNKKKAAPKKKATTSSSKKSETSAAPKKRGRKPSKNNEEPNSKLQKKEENNLSREKRVRERSTKVPVEKKNVPKSAKSLDRSINGCVGKYLNNFEGEKDLNVQRTNQALKKWSDLLQEIINLGKKEYEEFIGFQSRNKEVIESAIEFYKSNSEEFNDIISNMTSKKTQEQIESLKTFLASDEAHVIEKRIQDALKEVESLQGYTIKMVKN